MALDYSFDDGVAVLTLNRPEVLNAFDDELGFALLDAVSEGASDDAVRCIVITGAGRAFSAGEDLGALSEGYGAGNAPDLGDTLVKRYNPLIRAVRAAPKPVVAAVNGVAAGAGAALALACDFRIASEHAKLALGFIKVGLVPDSGAIWFLTRMIGSARAFELAAGGDAISAERALALGLYTKVAGAGDFEASWREFATALAAGPTRAYALTKALANSATEHGLGDQLDLEVKAQSDAGSTADHLEGVTAFLEKRPPRFTGR
jgi:2-(1,2-epoxy-1,2-dihydrophenyl)acetyl-CoA isomerase